MLAGRSQAPAISVGVAQLAISALIFVLDPVGLPIFAGALVLWCLVASLSIPGSLAASIAMLPLFHQPVRVSQSSLALSEILLWATVVGAVFAVAIREGTLLVGISAGPWRTAPSLADLWVERRRIRMLPVVALGVLAATGIMLLFAVDDAFARDAGFRELTWTLVEPLVLLVLLMTFARRCQDKWLLAGALVAGGVLASIWGLGQLVEGGGVAAGNVRRIDGPFPHPNAFALYLLRVVVFAGVLSLLWRRLRVAALVAAGLTGAALLASFARSALLALAATAVAVSGWVDRRAQVAGAALMVVGAGGLLLVAGDRMIGSSGTDSLELRLDIWESGLEMIRDRPVAGYGPDQFLYNYSPRYIEPTAWDERFTSHGHNFFIDAWVRLGIIGAAFALMGVCWIALTVSRVVRNPNRRSSLGVAAAVALAAAVLQGMVDNGYFAHDLAMSAWLLAWLAFDSPAASPTGGS